MKMIALLMMLFSSVALGASAPLGYPTATGIRLFKQNLDLNGQVSMLSGSVDPTATATSAPIGSIYMNTTSGILYRKLDAGSSTNWALATTGAIAQANSFGGLSYAAATSCDWTATSSSYVSFGAVTACPAPTVFGTATAPATKIPGVTFATMPAGDYIVNFRAYFGSGTSGNECYYRISDGTNTSGAMGIIGNGRAGYLQARFSYSTPQTAVTFQVQNFGNGTNACAIYNDAPANSQRFDVDVQYFPSQAQAVLTPALTPAYAAKQWSGASTNVTVGASTAPSATRTTISNANLSTYTLSGSAQNDASTNIQLTATLPAGDYDAMMTGLMLVNTSANGSSSQCVYELYDGTTAIASETITSNVQAAANIGTATHLRGYFKLTGTTTKTVTLRAAKINGDSSAGNYCQFYTDSASNALLSFIPRTQSVPMPVVINSVINPTAGVTNTVYATISGSATAPSLYSGGAGTGTITRNSTGDVTIALSAFSGTPSCVPSIIDNSTTLASSCKISAQSSTAVRILCGYMQNGSAWAPNDYSFNFTCMGPK